MIGFAEKLEEIASWIESFLFQVVIAYANGFKSVNSMYLYTFGVYMLPLILTGTLMGVWKYRNKKEDDPDAPKTLKSSMGIWSLVGLLLSFLVIIPVFILREEKTFQLILNQGYASTILYIFFGVTAVLTLIPIIFKSFGLMFLSLLFFIGFCYIMFKFVIPMVRDEKQIGVFDAIKEIFEKCPSTKDCNITEPIHNIQPKEFMNFVDNVIPDWMEKSIEKYGWKKIFDHLTTLGRYQQGKRLFSAVF